VERSIARVSAAAESRIALLSVGAANQIDAYHSVMPGTYAKTRFAL
jgi:hypothetical protein